jgi:hypothetical protein
MTKILEVNTSKSPINGFSAKVKAFGWYTSIENHLQMSKVFILPDGNEVSPASWKESKLMAKPEDAGGLGFRQADHFKLPDGRMIPSIYYYFGWYTHLWLTFFDRNPNIVKYAKQFDGFVDPYRGHSVIGVDSCIKIYTKQGREYLEARSWDFYGYLRNPETQTAYEMLLCSKAGVKGVLD